MRNLKQSETEEQRKERLRIRRENVKIENHEKQCLATLKILKRDDDSELKRNLRLEKVVAGKQLRLARRFSRSVLKRSLHHLYNYIPFFLRFVLLPLVLAVLCGLK